MALLGGGGSLIANGSAVEMITGYAQEAGSYSVINDGHTGCAAGADVIIKLVRTGDIPTVADFIS